MEKLAFDIGEEFKIGNGKSIIDLFRPSTGVPIPGYPPEPTLGYFISKILPNIYVLAGVIFFFLLVGGGLMVIVSAGQENPEGAAKGKQAITAALIGFLIIFASYWIMQIIKTITGIELPF